VRVASGVVFVSFGVGKFVNHASEAASFRGYGLPDPSLFTDVIGVLELGGGALLLVGLAARLAALFLAGDMVGAIVTSGLLHGETISLTLAPALLLAMIAVLLLGPGQLALDARREGRHDAP
jgi:putative oxidoreductase